MQQDAGAGAVDWTVSRDSSDFFEGSVFVVAEDGQQLGSATCDAPGDDAADRALAELGWTRLGDWTPDEYGRPAAVVTRSEVVVITLPPQSVPGQG
ncbi:hypothetical protein GIS00_06455 [Nakamurella sp. YIM 132087]|uniref:Uncharacterized protein n=1 Tax=Nakamurella alba TaxID=2665158 RepID=A0A7K1FL27_9ACTN|nr:hypothetical protein [Nakamurella alba]MTD13584.1 hypothetical protein [Nakamurella alba]